MTGAGFNPGVFALFYNSFEKEFTMTIFTSQDTFDHIMDLMHDYGTEFEPRTDYSGRGMYGRNCIGFTTDNATFLLMALTAVLIEIVGQYDDAPDWSDLRTAQDSMGLSAIVYFPNWQIEDE